MLFLAAKIGKKWEKVYFCPGRRQKNMTEICIKLVLDKFRTKKGDKYAKGRIMKALGYSDRRSVQRVIDGKITIKEFLILGRLAGYEFWMVQAGSIIPVTENQG